MNQSIIKLFLAAVVVLLLVKWLKEKPAPPPVKRAPVSQKETVQEKGWEPLAEILNRTGRKAVSVGIRYYFSLDDLLGVLKKAEVPLSGSRVREGVSAFSEGTVNLKKGEKENNRSEIGRAVRKLRASVETLPCLETYLNLGWAEYLYGYPGQAYKSLKIAEKFSQQASLAETGEDPAGIYRSLDYLIQNALGLCKISQGEIGDCLGHFNEGLALAKERPYNPWVGVLSRNLAKVFARQDKMELAERYLKEALVSDIQSGYLQGEISDCLMLADMSARSKLPGKSTGLYNRAFQLLKQSPNPRLEGDIHLVFGKLALAQQRYKEAISFFQKALTKYISVRDQTRQAEIFSRLAEVYQEKENLENAFKYRQESLLMYNEIARRDYGGGDLNNIGLAYYSDGDLSAAVKYYHGLLAVYRERSKKKEAAIVLGNLAKIYLDKHQPQKALELLEQAVLLDQEVNYENGLGIHITGQGLAFFRMGKRNKSLVYLSKAWSIFQKNSNKAGQALLYTHLGNLMLYEKKFEKALANYLSAKGIYSEQGDLLREARVLGKIGSVYFNNRKISEALGYLKKAGRKYKQLVTEFSHQRLSAYFSPQMIIPE